jgi:hypothetical protein
MKVLLTIFLALAFVATVTQAFFFGGREGGWYRPAREGGWYRPAREGGWYRPAREGGWYRPSYYHYGSGEE